MVSIRITYNLQRINGQWNWHLYLQYSLLIQIKIMFDYYPQIIIHNLIIYVQPDYHALILQELLMMSCF